MSSFTSSSRSPTQHNPNDIDLPDDAVLIQYPKIDPSDALEDSSLIYGQDKVQFYDKPVGEKLGGDLLKLLKTYIDLSKICQQINMATVQHKLLNHTLTHADIYSIVDKFYTDSPDLLSLPASYLSNTNNLKLLSEKLMMHNECQKELENFIKSIETEKAVVVSRRDGNKDEDKNEDYSHSTSSQNQPQNLEDEDDDEDDVSDCESVDDEVVKRKKKKRKLVKKKN